MTSSAHSGAICFQTRKQSWASRGILFWTVAVHPSSAPTSIKQATGVRTRLGIILTLKLHQASLNLPFVGFDDDLCSRLLCRNPTEYWNCVLCVYGGKRKECGTRKFIARRYGESGLGWSQVRHGRVSMDRPWRLAFKVVSGTHWKKCGVSKERFASLWKWLHQYEILSIYRHCVSKEKWPPKH